MEPPKATRKRMTPPTAVARKRFRPDNTYGYSTAHLAELNREYGRATEGETEPEVLERIASKVQNDFDARLNERLARRRLAP